MIKYFKFDYGHTLGDGLQKVVLKTALKTFIGLAVILVLAFTAVSLGLPGHMATFFEKTGNYSFATGYASLAYTYSGEYGDLARCVDDSILSGDDANVVNFALRMIDAREFEEYCKTRDIKTSDVLGGNMSSLTDFSYKQYVMGNLACSQYALGRKTDALSTAEKAMKDFGFPRNNAYAMLSRRAFENGDADMKSTLAEKVGSLTVSDADEEAYRKTILELLKL